MRDCAQKWLIQVQKLPEAWDFCPKLILETNETELKYYGASTLEHKLKNEWHSLPAEMQGRVLNIITSIVQNAPAKLDNIVCTRMCVVLSIVSMYTYAKLWPKPIENVIQLVCPDINNPMHLSSSDKMPIVLELPSPSAFLSTFDAALSYMCKEPSMIEPLILFVERSLRHLEEKLSEDMERVYSTIAERIYEVMPKFYASALAKSDTTITYPIVNLFAQIMQYNNSTMLSTDQIGRYMAMLIHFIDTGDRDAAELIFPVLDDFKTHPEYLVLDASMLDAFFIKVLQRVRILACHEEGPGDENDDEVDDQFNLFRSTSKEMFLNAQKVVLTDKMALVNHLLNQLRYDLDKHVNHWQLYESTLYFLSSLSQGETKENPILPIILQLIPSIPCKSFKLIKTTIKLVGKYVHFLKGNKEYLDRVVFDLIPAFANASLLDSAADSFRTIASTRACAEKLAPHIESIIDHCAPHIRTNRTHPSVEKVYEGLIQILHVIPSDKLLSPFTKLLTPIICSISDIIREPKLTDLPLLKINLRVVQHITNIINVDMDEGHDGKAEHPMHPFLMAITPLLRQLLNIFSTDCEVVEVISAAGAFIRIQPSHIKEEKKTEDEKIKAIEAKMKEAINNVSNKTLSTLQADTKSVAMSMNSVIPIQHPVDPQFQISFSIRPELTNNYFTLIQTAFKTFPQCLDPNIVSTLAIFIIHNLMDTTSTLTSRACFDFLATVMNQLKSTDPKYQAYNAAITNVKEVHGVLLVKNLIYEATKILLQDPSFCPSVSQCEKQIFLSQIQHVTDPEKDYIFSIQAFSILCKGTY
eukprot:gene11624-13570_t